MSAIGNSPIGSAEISGKDSSLRGSFPDNYAKNIKMLFFGDMMVDRHVKEKIDRHGLDHLFLKLDGAGLFGGFDLIAANLEGAVTDGGAHYLPDNAYDFAFKPETIDGLKKYGFNFFNLANNHLADQGKRGIIETSQNLSKLNIGYSGCDDGEAGECSFIKLMIRNRECGMAGFSMVYKKFDIAKAANIVSGLASATDLVVVNIHWGVEYEHQFNRVQQETAYALIDAGADIIIGHHPHVVQGMEIYESRLRATNSDHPDDPVKRPIFYSLGNFIFDQYFSEGTQEGLAVSIAWRADSMEITLLPMRSAASQPRLITGEEKDKFLNKFIKWSDINNEIKEQIKNGVLIISNF